MFLTRFRHVNSFLAALTLVLFGLPVYSQGTFGNIVINGDFEQVTVNAELPPWRWMRSLSFVGAEPWRAASGSNFAQVTGILYQDLPTIPDISYQLRFAFGGNEAGQVNSGPMIVQWGATQVASFPVLEVNRNRPAWNYYTYTVVATAPNTRLSFGTFPEAFPYLDDVSVLVIPEPPAGMVLLLSLFLSLCLPKRP